MKVVSKIISILTGILTGAFLFIMTYLDVIPMKYYIPFVGLILVLMIPILVFLLRKKTKTVPRIFLIFLSLLFSFCFLMGVNYAYTTLHFMKKANAIEEEANVYYVLVRKESPYQKIEDVKGKKIYTSFENEDFYKKALKVLEEKIFFTKVNCMDLRKMATDLLSNKVEVLFVRDSHKEIFDEEIPHFKENTRVLDTVTVKTKVEEVMKDVDSAKEPFSIYISGMDTYGTISARSRSDVNIVATINPNTYEILLTSIPRDYYVKLHGIAGVRDKLTHAGIYGINMSVKTIEDLLGTSINYYVRVNFDTLIKVVDVIGGIDVYSDITFPSSRKVSIVKGMNHMDGKTALVFARERKSYAEGDRHRGQNQQDVLTAIIKKVTSSKTLLTKYTGILNSLEGSLETNFPMDDMTGFVKKQIDKMPSWKISYYNLNGYDSSNITYSMGNMRLYVMEPDQGTISLAKTYVNGMKEGKTFSELGLS